MPKEQSKIRRLSDVKKDIEDGDDKIIIEDFLPEKIDFEYNVDLKNLLHYIESQGHFLSLITEYKKRDLKKETLFLNPAVENYKSFREFNSYKFLVHLSRQKIISDLYLPLYIREGKELDGSKRYQFEYRPSIIDWGNDSIRDALDWHLRDGSILNKYVIHFIVKDWVGFLKIKKELENKVEKNHKLPVSQADKIQEKPKTGVSFNSDKSILYINEYEVKVQKFTDQYELLRIIFEDPKDASKEWFFSEVAEHYDEADEYPIKKFYNAVYQLNKNIAVETGVKDFFIKNTQSFQINNRYLSES